MYVEGRVKLTVPNEAPSPHRILVPSIHLSHHQAKKTRTNVSRESESSLHCMVNDAKRNLSIRIKKGIHYQGRSRFDHGSRCPGLCSHFMLKQSKWFRHLEVHQYPHLLLKKNPIGDTYAASMVKPRGSQASYVLVQNVGADSLQLNFTVLPYNISVEDIAISGYQVKKVPLPSNTGGSSSVLVKVGDWHCTIQLGVLIPQPSYSSYLTPINGAYLFFVAVVFIGGTWSCCKFGKRVRHLKGVPYQELEMGQRDPDPTFTIESPNGWDDNWDDDDWDEEKAVKSPGANDGAKNMEDGATLKYVDTTQWGNDWDD